MDWELLQEIGIGTLQLSPFDFWQLTLGELWILLAGHRRRQRAEWTRTAQQTAWILNSFKKKGATRIKVEDLIGSEKEESTERKPRGKTTEAESKELVNELIDRFGMDPKKKYK
jgi:hypothetical protein